jgi:hypothetical protein
VVLISSAISLDLTNSVVGMPLRAQTEASAKPKFPPPMTAIRTGYGGGEDAFMESSWLLCIPRRLFLVRLVVAVAGELCRIRPVRDLVFMENAVTHGARRREMQRNRSIVLIVGNYLLSWENEGKCSLILLYNDVQILR